MKVIEIFSSIQGEGAFIGVPATFVRFAGCNLTCPFCDTKASWNEKNATQDLSPDELVQILCSPEHNTSIVVFTGGEPCMQEQLQELCDKIALRNRFICLETNGTLEVPYGINWVTCSPKPQANYQINMLCKPNELKYVVTEDFDAEKAIPEAIRTLYGGNIWLQPDGTDDATMQRMWAKAYQLAMSDKRLRVGVQLHKLMEVN